MRIDLWLVQMGLAPSRSKAQEWIERGFVFIRNSSHDWKKVDRPSQSPPSSKEDVRIDVPLEADWVSRGGEKLYHALKKISLDVQGKRALDMGTSTGGFAQCLLQMGCVNVVGVDVGHGQLHPSLTKDSRLELFEGLNVRDLGNLKQLKNWHPGDFDLITADLSFISLFMILDSVKAWTHRGHVCLALLKPQFEVGSQSLSKKGIVSSDWDVKDLKDRLIRELEAHEFEVKDFFPCAIKGGDGNQEYFVYAIRK